MSDAVARKSAFNPMCVHSAASASKILRNNKKSFPVATPRSRLHNRGNSFMLQSNFTERMTDGTNPYRRLLKVFSSCDHLLLPTPNMDGTPSFETSVNAGKGARRMHRCLAEG